MTTAPPRPMYEVEIDWPTRTATIRMSVLRLTRLSGIVRDEMPTLVEQIEAILHSPEFP